jgi:hypothetical protein
MKRYKSLGIDQIPAELIKAEDEILRSEIHKLSNRSVTPFSMEDKW